MRKTLIVANWKMNLNTHEASLLLHRYHQHIHGHHAIEVVVAPSMLSLQPLSVEIDRRRFRLAAQDGYYKDAGGFTGEVSFTMMRDLVHYAIVGHSARRIYFNENLETIREKMAAAVRNGIAPILCIGETKQERDDGLTKQVLHDQIVTALSNITPEEVHNVVIAYEPVWAISTFSDGQIGQPDDMEKAIAYIRFQIEELYGKHAAEQIRVLYGGSVDDHDALAYLQMAGCDGLLIGAASLNYAKFTAICDRAFWLRHGS